MSFAVFRHSTHLQYLQARRKSRLGRFQPAIIQKQRTSQLLSLYRNVEVGIRGWFDQEHKLPQDEGNPGGLRKFRIFT